MENEKATRTSAATTIAGMREEIARRRAARARFMSLLEKGSRDVEAVDLAREGLSASVPGSNEWDFWDEMLRSMLEILEAAQAQPQRFARTFEVFEFVDEALLESVKRAENAT